MNITYQNWSPDTCGCKVEEKWDKDDPQAGVSFNKVITKCSAHTSVADEDLFGVLYANSDGENKRKNQVRKLLTEDVGLALGELKTNTDGSTYLDFKNGIDLEWSFTGTGVDRVLTISVKGITLNATKRNAINSFCTTKFGVGKVEIV